MTHTLLNGYKLFGSYRLLFSLVTLGINLAILASLVLHHTKWALEGFGSQPTYSYIGEDYPIWFDVKLRPVEMTFEETVRYGMDGPVAQREWLSTVQRGYVRLGPDWRIFAVAMFHELHCVDMLRQALLNPGSTKANEHHVHHCLSYLRQLFLCSADSTLEPYDFVTRNYTQERVGIARTCRDWSMLYAHLRENQNRWGELALDED